MDDQLIKDVAEVMDALKSHSYRANNEAALQQAIASVFDIRGIIYEREVVIGPRDRVDFFVVGPSGTRIGVEVKTNGSTTSVAMQLHRYAESYMIDALVLATTRLRLSAMPQVMAAKPIHALVLPNGLFG